MTPSPNHLTDQERSRREFEAYASANMAGNHFSLERLANSHPHAGKYAWNHVQEAWVVWQAAFQHQQSRIDVLEGGVIQASTQLACTIISIKKGDMEAALMWAEDAQKSINATELKGGE